MFTKKTARWSVVVHVIGEDKPALSIGAKRELRTASVGKLLILTELAARLEVGTEYPNATVDRRDMPAVGGTGLWQSMTADTLSVSDAAVLVGAHSDNLAANALTHQLGLDAVNERAETLGMGRARLLDTIKDQRDVGEPATFSLGSAADWAMFAERLATNTLVSPGVSERVGAWMGRNADLSLIASTVFLDPLNHERAVGDGVLLRNRTGSDMGVSADIGYLVGRTRTVAYAAIANWDEAEQPTTRTWVRTDMREIGETVRRLAA